MFSSLKFKSHMMLIDDLNCVSRFWFVFHFKMHVKAKIKQERKKRFFKRSKQSHNSEHDLINGRVKFIYKYAWCGEKVVISSSCRLETMKLTMRCDSTAVKLFYLSQITDYLLHRKILMYFSSFYKRFFFFLIFQCICIFRWTPWF